MPFRRLGVCNNFLTMCHKGQSGIQKDPEPPSGHPIPLNEMSGIVTADVQIDAGMPGSLAHSIVFGEENGLGFGPLKTHGIGGGPVSAGIRHLAEGGHQFRCQPTRCEPGKVIHKREADHGGELTFDELMQVMHVNWKKNG
jgi:hypothetical protein